MVAAMVMAGALAWALAEAAASPELTAELVPLREIAAHQGEALWPGLGTAPFGMLLIDGEDETLLCHPSDPPDFTEDGVDEATGCRRLVRPRTDLPDNLLAALPLFGPPSVIVMGTPEATGSSRPRWRATVLHEHFHQWQDDLPGIYGRVDALDLAGDDRTGMWMLQFPFPYAEPAVAQAFAEASRALGAAVRARGTPGFPAALADYLARRRAFAVAAGERNWRYFEFQLWKEGVARWTEIVLSRASGDAALIAEAADREQRILAELGAPDLPERGRVAVYAYGAAEAMLLEACGPSWRGRYMELLSLGPLFDEAGRSCGAEG